MKKRKRGIVMNQGEAAESIVRMSLNGVETFVRISGAGIKGAIALMYAYSKDNKQLKGKTSLKNMLRSGKELKVFTIKEKDFKKFVEQARKYGILYCSLLDKKGTNLDGYVDIMVRAEDAPRINRIVERFNLVSFDEAKIKAGLNKDKLKKMQKEGLEKGTEIKDINDSKFVDEILGRNINKENIETSNPSLAGMEKGGPSVPSSKNRKSLEESSKKTSVRKELKEIRKNIEKRNIPKDRSNIKTKRTNKIKNHKTKIR